MFHHFFLLLKYTNKIQNAANVLFERSPKNNLDVLDFSRVFQSIVKNGETYTYTISMY